MLIHGKDGSGNASVLNDALAVTAPVTVGDAAAIAAITATLSDSDAGRLFYDTDVANAGGIGWQLWAGATRGLITDYTYVTQATLLSGEDQTNDVLVVEQGRFWPEVIAVGVSDTLPVAGAGAAGDYLDSVTFPKDTTIGTCVVTDGTYTITFPAATKAGTYQLHWTSTAAGFTVTNNNTACIVICTGRFTA